MTNRLALFGKRLWMKFGVGIERAVHTGDLARLERAYRIADPWGMARPREQTRYRLLNDLIRRHFGPLRSILEIGSGEGHHTTYLQELAPLVVGVEVSATALARARLRCPGTKFVQAPFPHLPEEVRTVYDLVVASEALYFLRDMDTAISTMTRHGRGCLVTCYEPEIPWLDRHLLPLPTVSWHDLKIGRMRFRAYLWWPRGKPEAWADLDTR